MQPMHLSRPTCHHFPCKAPVVRQLHARIYHDVVIPQPRHVMAQQCALTRLQSHIHTYALCHKQGLPFDCGTNLHTATRSAQQLRRPSSSQYFAVSGPIQAQAQAPAFIQQHAHMPQLCNRRSYCGTCQLFECIRSQQTWTHHAFAL
jgi:hypothetical protein